MKYIYGKNDLKNFKRGEENCYLLTDGLGGYSSQTILCSNSRQDHALYMMCPEGTGQRYNMISRFDENLKINGINHQFSIQQHVSNDYTNDVADNSNNYKRTNEESFSYINSFEFDVFPKWRYQIKGVEIEKTYAMQYKNRFMAVKYTIINRMNESVELTVVPQLQFEKKGEVIEEGKLFSINENMIQSSGMSLYYQTNGSVSFYNTTYCNDYYYHYDERDGRPYIGKSAHNHVITYSVESGSEKVLYILYGNKEIDIDYEAIFINERIRQEQLIKNSMLNDEIAKQLVISADQFIIEKPSTGLKTILAGYPFFEDWGRDTMIAVIGCCISTRRYEDVKNILRLFMKHVRNGLMPNLFPEGDHEPVYNTVDASLLFINAVYEYYKASGDKDFVVEAFDVMVDIIDWYIKGTDYNILMDADGLLTAGEGYAQVTWMDVRYDDILPTKRHGKPVEINAYWYNASMIMHFFSMMLHDNKRSAEYYFLAENTKNSFVKMFWNDEESCLKDLISDTFADKQIRCNQIWAVSLPFTMLTKEQERMVVDKVFEKLYTPYGLRSLAEDDEEFKGFYGGSHFNRDMAYHQGTVWAFPLGAYYLAYLKAYEYSDKAVCRVREQLLIMEACLREGCIGQIAEIYDGSNPTESRGCFAQAWSVGEILRVYAVLESISRGKTKDVLNNNFDEVIVYTF